MLHIARADAEALAVYQERNENRLARIYEPEEGLFIAESIKVIERALSAGYRPESLLLEEALIPKFRKESPAVARLIDCQDDIPVYTADRKVLESITGYALTGGALCAMIRRAAPPAEKLLAGKTRVAVLDHVTNPTNVGAIVRSASALGIDAVLFTEGTSDPLYRRAVRVSMGSIFQIPWTIIPSRDELFPVLRAHGFQCAAMALREEAVSMDAPKLKNVSKLAIILGNEGDGLPEDALLRCDYLVRIPMHHGTDSLNVAASSAVAFWELRKHHKKNIQNGEKLL